MKRKLFLTVAVASVLMIAGASSALALSKPKLSFVKSGGATIGWTTAQGSSPADLGNSSSLRYNVPVGGGVSAYTYGASETLVGIRGKHLSEITRLGFDSRGYLGAGAPRFSIGTTGPDGDHTFFLSAYYCNDALSGGWRTSDFSDSALSPGTSTGCTIFDQSGNTFPSIQAAGVLYPDDVVISSPNDWFFIVDESPAVGNIDRLTVQDWMWNKGGNQGIVNCNDPGCI